MDSAAYGEMGMETTGASAEPVTIVVSRDVVAGHEADYQAWMHRVIETAGGFRGNLGATVLVPDAPSSRRNIVIHRWADESSMHAWERSEERSRLPREADATRRAATNERRAWRPGSHFATSGW
jgi:antibiotic biosynthesis monooxygenase (ABM) superfamily enzyme